MDGKHPFRFGVNVSAPVSPNEWIEMARNAEALGYHSLQMSDHLGNHLGPLSALVLAAEATTKIRLASYVFGNDFRNPIFLAQEAASIDLISDGRLEFGLGTGYSRGDYLQSGIPLDSPGVRVSRLTEAVQVIKGFFGNEPFSFDGEYYQVQDLVGLPKPVQQPHPPIALGGGAKRTLSLAAREADIVSVNIKTTPEGGFDFSSLTAEAAAQKVDWVRHAAGNRFSDLTLNILVPLVAITDRPRQAAEAMLKQYGVPETQFSVDQVLDSPSALIGTVDQIVETLQMRREQYGFSYVTVWPPLEPFAPVVERLAGK